jgi:hypothetical protein
MQRLGLRERLRENEVIDAWSKSSATSSPHTQRPSPCAKTCSTSVFLQYELEQISKPEVLRKMKQRFGAKTIREIRFRVG